MNESITSLSDLAAQANENHQLAEATAGSALEYARKSGEALTEAKSLVKHGEWMAWVRDNFSGKRQTAQNYMQLAANYQRVGNLEPASINDALRMIAGEDEEEEAEPEVDEPEEIEAEPQHGEVESDEEPEKDQAEEPREVEVEVVGEDEGLPEVADPEADEQPEPEAGVALVYARTAIDALNKIPKRDPSRKAALKMISDWLNKQ